MGGASELPAAPSSEKRSSPGRSQGRKQQVPVPIAAAAVVSLPAGAGSDPLEQPSTLISGTVAVPRMLPLASLAVLIRVFN